MNPQPINELIHGDESVEIRFLENAEHGKSDAIVLLFHGRDSLQITLIDGGQPNARTLDELLRLRETLLRRHPVEHPECWPLSLRLIITHCHVDHIGELYRNILPCSLLKIEEIYLPPATELPADGRYNDDRNGDYFRRPMLMDAIAQYAPDVPVRTLAFHETLDLPCPCGSLRLFAPSTDFGTPENVAFTLRVQCEGADAETIKTKIPMVTVNANSMWARVTCGSHSMLFTGDSVKRDPNRNDESFDRMIDAYGEQLRSDVVKYPHHGVKRNAAAAPLVRSLLKPGGLVVLATADADNQGAVELDQLGAPHVNVAHGLIVFRFTQDALTRE